MPNQNYPSDLTDSQWEHIKELLPKTKRQRRPRELEMRQVVNAIFYVVVGGIAVADAAARLPEMAERLLLLSPLAQMP